jgi:hypothetical protein
LLLLQKAKSTKRYSQKYKPLKQGLIFFHLKGDHVSIDTYIKGFKKLVVDNSPLILTYISVAGVISTTVMAVKATPKALDHIQWAQHDADHNLTTKEIVQVAWKHYIPAASIGVVTLACIIGAQRINSKRSAALVTVYTITENAFKEYKAKVKQEIGSGKEEKIRSEIAKDYIESAPMVNAEVMVTGLGEQLCYDTFTGRYFKSDIETIRRAQNDINAGVINDMYASHNDFYRLIGLPPTSYGEEIGWNMDNMMNLEYSAHLAEDGRPCISIEYHATPVRGFYKIN